MEDQQGWLLLAGENADVVARGTRREVESMLPCVCSRPRDSYSGQGCWVILAPDRSEALSGTFTRDGWV